MEGPAEAAGGGAGIGGRAVGRQGGRGIILDGGGPLDALGRHVEGPGQNQCDRESRDEQDEDQLVGPVRRTNDRSDDGRDLQQQPRHHQIGDADPHDVPALQFLEEVCHSQATPRPQRG